MNPAPTGLGPAQGFGPVGVNTPNPAFVRDDTPTPADPTTAYPEVALVPVKDARQLVQVVPVDGTVVLDGNGEGVVDAAGAGVLDGTAPVLYAATTRKNRALMERCCERGAHRAHRHQPETSNVGAQRPTPRHPLRADQIPPSTTPKTGVKRCSTCSRSGLGGRTVVQTGASGRHATATR